MLPSDMDISRVMVYAQQIEESKIRKIRQEGKRPRSDDYIHKNHNMRYYHHDSSMGNEERDPNQSGGHSSERTRYPTCGKQHLGKCHAGTDGCFSSGNMGNKMRDFPNIKARGKEVNKSSLDPNAPKNNTSYGMGARKDN